jgi:hypothetical protein
MIKLVKELAEDFVLDKRADYKHTRKMSDVLFHFENKMVGGLARESFLTPPELWVAISPAFNIWDIRRLLPQLRIAVEHWKYIRARVIVGDGKAMRFAEAFGFKFEETKNGFHFYSVRA